jgi:hypothetical protein
MIRPGDSVGLGAFELRGRTRDAGAPAIGQRGPVALEDDLLGLSGGIRSDPAPAVRGLSVAQHAANVLSHLCRETH